MKREGELHREILAFSVSHDDRTVRIYGHYPIIDGNNITFYRHPIREFSFTELDGREKWAAYNFIKSVYDIWMPIHLKRVCSVVDKLPADVTFKVALQSESGSSGLSQGLESHYLSDHDAESRREESDSQSSRAASREVTPDTSQSHWEERASKKQRKRGFICGNTSVK